MKKENSGKETIRFASYNIFHGGAANCDISKIAKNITDNNIDIIGIQEVDRGTLRSGGVDILKELSEISGYPYYAFFKTIDFKGGDYGVAVLSKYPIVSSEKILLRSEGTEQRALGITQIDLGERKITFLVTHLTFRNKDIRISQLSQLADILSQMDEFVLTGDFNTFDLGALDGMSGVGRVNRLDSPTVTFPDGNLCIDNIVYSESTWCFGKINLVTESYSDHYMIYADGELKK